MPNYNVRRIRPKSSYNINEIIALLEINRKTCYRWIKHMGLKVIEENVNPVLIMGIDLQNFIKERRAKKGRPLKDNEFFCLKCREAVKAKTGSEKIIKTGKRIGKDDKEQYKKTGICDICGIKLNKFLRVYHSD